MTSCLYSFKNFLKPIREREIIKTLELVVCGLFFHSPFMTQIIHETLEVIKRSEGGCVSMKNLKKNPFSINFFIIAK